MSNGNSVIKDQALELTRILNAPVELVWEAITDPDHISKWWGPDGFTITIGKMEVRPGGEWNLIMHGPDGTDYENRIIYKEVVKHKRLVLEYQTSPRHVTTVELKAQGKQTMVRWHMTFESEEQIIQLIRDFKVDKGLEQNVERWSRYLVSLQ